MARRSSAAAMASSSATCRSRTRSAASSCWASPDFATSVMRRVQALMADVDADRTVVQARLSELGRRIDETYARAR